MKHSKRIKVDANVSEIGGGVFAHDLICYMCKRNNAVYDAYPNWHFIPCWDCQKQYHGIWSKTSLWQRFINYINK